MKGLTMSRWRTSEILVVAGILCTAPVRSTSAGDIYTIYELGTLGGESSRALAMSNAGHVVGFSDTLDVDEYGRTVSRATLWRNGATIDLGAFGSRGSVARDVNDQGQIVGSSQTDELGDTFYISRAFLWFDGIMTEIGDRAEGYPFSSATSINEHGEVAGYDADNYSRRAFIWLPSARYGLPAGSTYLGTLSGLSSAYPNGINSSAQIVGVADHGDYGPRRAFLWLPEPALGLPAGMTAIAYVWPFEEDEARAINDLGMIVGIIGARPFLWHDFAWIDLPFQGVAFAVNNAGQILVNRWFVGYYVWQGDELAELGPRILNARPWGSLRPTDLNDPGEIVGYGTNPEGHERAFLLSPVDADFDRDGDTDLGDCGRLLRCLTGPDMGVAEPCARQDLDADGDVDLNDVRGLFAIFTGAR